MDKSILGRTGLEITPIGFGGIPIQRLGVDEAVSVVAKALDLGVGLIDTARVYTDSEDKIGIALAGRSPRPVLVSKSYSRDADGMRRDIEVSLEKLGVPHIELYLLHNINRVELLDEVMSRGGAYEGVSKARSEGTVGFVGLSSHQPSVLEEAARREAFDVIEAPFSAVEQQCLPAMEEAARRNIGVIVMKPLAGGALRQAAAAIRFVLAHPVSCVIPGMQTVAEVTENLAAAGEQSQGEREALLAEAKEWAGRFCRRCEYCLPACPNNINITLTLLFAAYSKRYGLKEWAHRRYAAMPVHADVCEECGKCEERCPYELPIREMLKEAHAELTS